MKNDLLFVDDKLCLEELSEGHIEEIYKTIDSQRAYLGEWLPFVEYSREEAFTKAFVESYTLSDRANVTFALFYDGLFAGVVGLKDTDFQNLKTEIGYWLSEPFQHQGLMTRACKFVVRYAFEKMGMNRIQLKAAAGNRKSQKVAERLGFKQEGVERDGEKCLSGFWDLNVYSLLHKEFVSLKNIYA